MGKKIAVDFGTSNTVIALWNENTGKEEILSIKNISRTYDTGPFGFNSPFVPSLIHFNDNHILIGNEVIANSLEFSPNTFRDMKQYILNKKSLPKYIGGKKISFFQAGEKFLSRLISGIRETINEEIDEIIFTIPGDSSQDYHKWLIHCCEEWNIKHFRLIDEPVACAMGYDRDIVPDDVLMVFDFGGCTLDIAIVKAEMSPENNLKSMVLGKGEANLGGLDIDNWILEDVAGKNNNHPDEVMNLLREAEKIKIYLSFQEKFEMGKVVYSREDFEKKLVENNFFDLISDTIDIALYDAEMKGIKKSHIKYVLMTGGSSLIPSVRKFLEEKGYNPFISNPFIAVASGACRFTPGTFHEDYICHDYAIKNWLWSEDRYNGDYGFRRFIKRGVKYPVKNIATFIIDGALPGQGELEFVIFEINQHIWEVSKNEMIYNPNTKKYEIRNITFNQYEETSPINEKNPLVIKLDPPSKGGEKRISLSFSIDEHRMLKISAVDLKTNRVIYDDEPVVMLR